MGPALRGPRKLLQRPRACPLLLTGCSIFYFSHPSLVHQARGSLQRLRKGSSGQPPFPSPDPYHLAQPRRGHQHGRADSQPRLTCARRRGSRPYPAILPRPVSAPSRSPPPRLPTRLLIPSARSRAHPTPRLRACSITVPGGGLQASPALELFEYANKRLGANQ